MARHEVFAATCQPKNELSGCPVTHSSSTKWHDRMVMHLLLNLQANGRVRHGLGETTPFHDAKVKESKELRL